MKKLACALTLAWFALPSWADLTDLIQRYDQTSWQVSDEDTQLSEFEAQLAELEGMSETSEVLMWQGAVAASMARIKGGAGALGLIKQAKKDLDAALDVDPDNAMARAIRGNIFAKAPGWPLSVGSKKKAAADFVQALQAQPNNILALQGYGEFLADQGDRDQARIQYQKALGVEPRVGREMADTERQKAIQALLNSL